MAPEDSTLPNRRDGIPDLAHDSDAKARRLSLRLEELSRQSPAFIPLRTLVALIVDEPAPGDPLFRAQLLLAARQKFRSLAPEQSPQGTRPPELATLLNEAASAADALLAANLHGRPVAGGAALAASLPYEDELGRGPARIALDEGVSQASGRVPACGIPSFRRGFADLLDLTAAPGGIALPPLGAAATKGFRLTGSALRSAMSMFAAQHSEARD